MSYRAPVLRAVVARLQAASLGVPVLSASVAGQKPPFVAVTQVTAEEPLAKGEAAAFHRVEVWLPYEGLSPVELMTLSDAVQAAFLVPLTDPLGGARLDGAHFVEEDDLSDLDAPGGPLLVKQLSFRLLAQAI